MKFICLTVFIIFSNIIYATLNKAQERLIDAIKNNNKEELQALLITKQVPYQSFLGNNKIAQLEHVNFLTTDKQTPLTLAIKQRNVDLVKILIDFGADINISGESLPISLALKNEDYEIVNMILKNKSFNINAIDAHNNTCFKYLIIYKKWLEISYLYNYYYHENNKNYKIHIFEKNNLCNLYLESNKNNYQDAQDIKDAWLAYIRALFFTENYDYQKTDVIYFFIEKDFLEGIKEYKKIYEENSKNSFITLCKNINILNYCLTYNAIIIIEYFLKELNLNPDDFCDKQKRTVFFKAVIGKKYNIAFLLFTYNASLDKKDKYKKSLKQSCISNANSIQFLSLIKQISKYKSDEDMNNIINKLNNSLWSIDKHQTWLTLELKQVIINYLKKLKAKRDLLTFAQEQTQDNFMIDCIICHDSHMLNNVIGPALCQCFICEDCSKTFIKVGLENARNADFVCPNKQCSKKVRIEYLKHNNISDEKLEQYALHLHLRFSKYTINCPTPDCIGGIVLNNNDDNTYVPYDCAYCNFDGCIRCQKDHHIGDCKAIVSHEDNFYDSVKSLNIRPCPKCLAPIEKNQGCSQMKCFKCGYGFTWWD